MRIAAIFLGLLLATGSAWASELCLSCTGTTWVAASPDINIEEAKYDQNYGVCFETKTLKITYDTLGSDRTKWKFDRKTTAYGRTYFYWGGSYSNAIQGNLKEEMELGDVTLTLSYRVKDAKDSPVMETRGRCTPSIRIDK